jgi:hypothetical protein
MPSGDISSQEPLVPLSKSNGNFVSDAPENITTNGAGYVEQPSIHGDRLPSVSRDDIWAVHEDEDDGTGRHRKRARKSTTNGTAQKSAGGGRRFGCAICQSPDHHPALYCPIVQAGPESILQYVWPSTS